MNVRIGAKNYQLSQNLLCQSNVDRHLSAGLMFYCACVRDQRNRTG